MAEANRLERKKAQTKEKIFNTAVELFLKQGYDNTTVDEIVEKADVAKGTFFNHFPTKDAILFYLGQQRVALVEELLIKELKIIGSAKEKLFRLFKVFGQVNEDNKEITALILKEMFSRMFSKMEQEKESQRQLKTIIVALIQEGQLQGEFRSDINPGHVADVLNSTYFFTLFEWVEGELNNSFTVELFARAEIIMAGIS